MFDVMKWVDHYVTPKNSYKLVQNSDGTVTLVPAGTVIQQGTSMNAANFNRMESGIVDAHIANRLLSIALKSPMNVGVSGDQVAGAVEAALQEAKASGEFDGKDGKDGKDGANGTSVYVTKVTESTADGGSNVVTFSDGKTLTVKNGTKGSAGAQGGTGPQGAAGANATINGVNTLTIASGAGIKATQSGNTLTLAATYTYGTESITAGSASSHPNGTLHFVYE